ncbi:MAG: PAS domain S-box protein [Candidatus Delongbacteria bacterium]|nr:PAS domain S-box protein [Candidatus Delongbacteria bacterium]
MMPNQSTPLELDQFLLEMMPHGVIDQDRDGRILYANSAAAEVFMLTPDQMMGMLPADLLRKAVRDDGSAFDTSDFPGTIALGTGQAVRNVIMGMAVPESNDYRWFEISAVPRRKMSDGAIIGVLSIWIDITRHRIIEEKLRNYEEKYRILFDNHHSVMLLLDPKTGKILDVNQAAVEYYSWTRNELLTMNIAQINILTQEEIVAEMNSAIAMKKSCFNFHHRRADGSIRDVEVYSGPVQIKGKQLLFSFIYDVSDRLRAEKVLKESLENLKRSQAIAHVGSWSWDIIADRFIVSEEGLKIMGFPLDSYPSFREVTERIHPQDRDRSNSIIAESLSTGNPYSMEMRIFKKDTGELRYLISMGEVEMDNQKKPIRVFGISQDITERKQVEDALRENQRFMADLIEHSGALIYVKNCRGGYQLVNRKWEEVTGLMRQEVLGKTDQDLFPPADAQVFRSHDLNAMESDRVLELDEVLTYPNGNRYFISVKFPLHSASGEVTGLCGMTTEITDRRQHEEELRESENRFRELIELAVDGILLGSPQGIIIGANQAFCDMIGFSSQAIIGIDIRDLPFKPESIQASPLRYDLLRQGQIVEAQRIMINPEGEEIHVEMRTKMMPDGSYQSIYRDITERKRSEAEHNKLQAQLVQAQKMESVGRLAGGVAHDFNNMLGVILGYTDLGLAEIEPDHPLAANLKEIRKAAERSANLTRQLLAFARKQTVSPIVIDLNATVEGMLRMLERLIGENIKLSWIPGSELGSVMIDPSQIDQILANLCVNARDAIKGNGRITIETENVSVDENYCRIAADAKAGDYIRLIVSDNGAGMDKETLGHLFEPFFTTKELGRGTGLGLATIYGIVRQNDGFITVYSEPGQGTSIKIYLPRHREKRGTQSPESKLEPLAARQGTILLVEDEPAILKMTSIMLTGLGYKVLAASTPGQAIAMAREHSGEIDLLMTDVIMPEMNGRELAKNMLSIYPQLGRLFMSGYTADVIAHHGVLDEGVHFIQKPFTIRELSVKIREILDH